MKWVNAITKNLNSYKINHARFEACFCKKIWTNPGLFFVHLSFQKQLQFQFTQHKLKKMKLVCLRFEPGATGWQAQSKLWNYGGCSNF